MSKVIDLSTRRARDNDSLPRREADIELQAWLKDDEVDWIWTAGPFMESTEEHTMRTAALLDAAWLYGQNAGHDDVPDQDRPLFWWLLRADGNMTLLYSKSLYTDTSTKHAWWFLRQWWRMTKKSARIAWRIARGRG